MRHRRQLLRRLRRAEAEERRRQRQGVLARLEAVAAAGGTVGSIQLLDASVPCAELQIEGTRVRLIGVQATTVSELSSSASSLRLDSVADHEVFVALYFTEGGRTLPLLAARAQLLPAGGGPASRPAIPSLRQAGPRGEGT